MLSFEIPYTADDATAASSTVRASNYVGLAQRSEARSNFFREELRLFPRRKVAALGNLVVVNEFRIGPFCPTARNGIDLVRKDAHGHWDGDALDVEESQLVCSCDDLPIETRGRNPGVRQPVMRDAVEHVVACEAFSLSVEHARDERVADHVVVENPRGEADG